MRLYKYGSVLLKEYDGADQFQAQARRSLTILPNGAFDNDGPDYIAQPTRVSRRFTLAEENGDISVIQDEFDEFSTVASRGRNVLVGVLRDGLTYRQTWAKVSRIRNNFENGNMSHQVLDATFEIDYPYWIKSEDEVLYFDTGWNFDSGLFFDAGQVESQTLSTPSTVFTLTNDGGAAINRGNLTFTLAAASSATEIIISNGANGMVLTLTDSFVAGDEIVIDLLPKSITKNDVGAYDILSLPSNQVQWMTLDLGDNEITITVNGLVGSVDLKWRWARQYIA
jgi:phage-related protein